MRIRETSFRGSIGVPIVIGLVFGVCAALIPTEHAALFLQLLAAAIAVGAYIRFSESIISALSVVFLSIGMFVGIAGTWVRLVRPSGTEDGAIVISLCLLGGTAAAVGVAVAVHRRSAIRYEAPDASQQIERFPFLIVAGTGFIIASSILPRLEGSGPLAGAFAYLGVLAFFTVASRQFVADQRSIRTLVYGVMLAGSLWAYLLQFSGFGRIVVAELALGCVVIFSTLRPSVAYRWLAVFGIGLAIVFGSIAGITRSSDLTVAEAWAETISRPSDVVRSEVGGLSSFYAPMETTERLLELRNTGHPDVTQLRLGRTYVGALLVPIPRAVWAAKPVQLNKEIVATLEPTLAGTTYSHATGLWGEALLNFGLVGIVGVPVFVAYLAGKGDQWYRRKFTTNNDAQSDLIVLIYASTVSGIPDLAWGGSETFASRAGVRLAILVALYLVIRRLPERSGAHGRTATTVATSR